MKRFSKDLRPGAIIHVTHLKNDGTPDRRWWAGFGELIQWYLKDGSHDAVVIQGPSGLSIGDMRPLLGRLTPLGEYEDEMSSGKIAIRVFWPKDATPYDGLCASNWWRTHEVGKLYNLAAFPLLLLKIFSDKVQWGLNLAWDWCTEGCMWAWLSGAGIDVYRNKKPTPLTTEKRFKDGSLIDITDISVETC